MNIEQLLNFNHKIIYLVNEQIQKMIVHNKHSCCRFLNPTCLPQIPYIYCF